MLNPTQSLFPSYIQQGTTPPYKCQGRDSLIEKIVAWIRNPQGTAMKALTLSVAFFATLALIIFPIPGWYFLYKGFEAFTLQNQEVLFAQSFNQLRDCHARETLNNYQTTRQQAFESVNEFSDDEIKTITTYLNTNNTQKKLLTKEAITEQLSSNNLTIATLARALAGKKDPGVSNASQSSQNKKQKKKIKDIFNLNSKTSPNQN